MTWELGTERAVCRFGRHRGRSLRGEIYQRGHSGHATEAAGMTVVILAH